MRIDAPSPSQIPALRSLWREAFGDTEEFLDTFEATAFSTKRCRCVTIGGNIVAALYWFDCSYMDTSVAYIYAVATANEYRSQGICHRLMTDTHHHLINQGYDGAILVPGDSKLFDFYESMGYKTCCHIDEIRLTDAPDTSKKVDTASISEQINNVRLEIIDKYEYARERRKFLPQGSIIQENENLDFLETQAKFYMGTDFLLAARLEGQTVLGLELLGKKDVTPQIMSRLGCTNGIFRTPGNSKPFAMYLPLGHNKLLPSYFAFAFD